MIEHPLAVIRTTDDLQGLFRRRTADLNITFETVDYVGGLPTRYTAKLLSPDPRKHFGKISFEALLGTLGLMLVAPEDPEALARVQRRLVPLQRHDHNWREALKREQALKRAMTGALR
jgi:hypothetical protein